jgi:hypothetical protein
MRYLEVNGNHEQIAVVAGGNILSLVDFSIDVYGRVRPVPEYEELDGCTFPHGVVSPASW